jgi:hypothetical protein
VISRENIYFTHYLGSGDAPALRQARLPLYLFILQLPFLLKSVYGTDFGFPHRALGAVSLSFPLRRAQEVTNNIISSKPRGQLSFSTQKYTLGEIYFDEKRDCSEVSVRDYQLPF